MLALRQNILGAVQAHPMYVLLVPPAIGVVTWAFNNKEVVIGGANAAIK